MWLWLQQNIGNVIALALTGVVCYLAVVGVQEARAGLISTFSVLAGSLYGAHQALRVPGKDS